MRSLVNGTGQNHHPGTTLPLAEAEGTRLRLIAGTGWGLAAPVAVSSPLFYAGPALAPGTAPRSTRSAAPTWCRAPPLGSAVIFCPETFSVC